MLSWADAGISSADTCRTRILSPTFLDTITNINFQKYFVQLLHMPSDTQNKTQGVQKDGAAKEPLSWGPSPTCRCLSTTSCSPSCEKD